MKENSPRPHQVLTRVIVLLNQYILVCCCVQLDCWKGRYVGALHV